MKPKKLRLLIIYSLIIINFLVIAVSSPDNKKSNHTKLFGKIDKKRVALNKSKDSSFNNVSENIEYNYNKNNELTLLNYNLKKYEFSRINTVIRTNSSADVDHAVKGIERAVNFFKNITLYKDKFKINIYILDEVPDYMLNKGISFNLYYGFVDREDLIMFMPSYKIFLRNEYGIMNIKLNKEFYISYFSHEAAHVITENILKDLDKNVRIAYHEFIAYLVQMDTMEDQLLKNILVNFNGEKWLVFESSKNITYEYYLINSDGFAVKSYLFYKSYEGSNFFAGLFEKENTFLITVHN